MPTGMDISPYGRGRFPRAVRLGGNRFYRLVYRKGKSYPSRNLSLVYMKGRGVKVGFSASSKVGCAAVRNRVRRILREDARKIIPMLKNGRYVFVARPSAASAAHTDISRDMIGALERAGLFREE